MKIKSYLLSTFLMTSLTLAGGYQSRNFDLGQSHFYDFVSKRFPIAEVYFSVTETKEGKTYGSLYLQYRRLMGIPDMPFEISQIVIFPSTPMKIEADGTFELKLPNDANFYQVSDPVIRVRKIRGTIRNPYSMFRIYKGIDLYDGKDQKIPLL